MDDESALRAARRARAASNWADKIFTIEDHSDPSRYTHGNQQLDPLSTMIPGVADEDAGAGVYDLTSWDRLEAHVRHELQLASERRLVLIFKQIELGLTPIHVTGSTSLQVLHRQLDAHGDELDMVVLAHAQLRDT